MKISGEADSIITLAALGRRSMDPGVPGLAVRLARHMEEGTVVAGVVGAGVAGGMDTTVMMAIMDTKTCRVPNWGSVSE